MYSVNPISHTSLLTLFTVLSLLSLLPSVIATCYYPDGSTPDQDYVPCNTTTDSSHSACCASGDACSATGYCFGSSGFPYRGACTDSTWNATECCPACKDSATHSFSVVYHCPYVNGSATGLWCCGAQEGSPEANAGCCNTTLFDPMDSGGFQHFFVPEAEEASTTSTSTVVATLSLSTTLTSATASGSTTSSLSASSGTPTNLSNAQSAAKKTSSTSNHDGAIGAGIGVPLGVLLLASLGALFLRERRRRLRAEEPTKKDRSASLQREGEKRDYGFGANELSDQGARQEMGNAPRWPAELNSRQVHEAAEAF